MMLNSKCFLLYIQFSKQYKHHFPLIGLIKLHPETLILQNFDTSKQFSPQGRFIDTAYVLNFTLRVISKLSMAFINPMHPIWNKSSTFSLDEENLLITLNTNLRFPLINFSLASISPSLIRTNKAFLR